MNRTRTPMKRTHRFFPEPLEARIAPATLTWDGSAGNEDWFTPANWSGNAVPGPGDVAVLDINTTINLTANAIVGAFVLSDGTFTGAADLTVTGNLTWTGGSMQGAGTTSIAGAGSSISGAGSILLSRELVNSGTLAFSSGDTDFGLRFGAVLGAPGELRNTAAGTVNATAGGDLNAFFTDPGHHITNAGTWNVSGAGFESTVGIPFENTGSVNVLSGTASFAGGGTHSGAWSVAATHTLRFASGEHLFGAGTALNVAGTLEVSGGLFGFNAGSFNVARTVIGGGEARFDAAATTGTLVLSDGTQSGAADLTVTGNLTWTGGSMQGAGTTSIAGAGSSISGAGSMLLSRELLNSGTLTFSSGDANFGLRFGAVLGAPGELRNTAAGTVNVTAGGDLNAFSTDPGHRITNAGTWNVSGAGFESIVAIPFENTGSVNVTAGTLKFDDNFTQSTGSTRLAGGTIVTTPGMTFAGGELSGAGTITGNVANTGGTVRPGGSGVGVIAITGDYAQGAAGTLALDIGGTTPGTQHDWLSVTGTAALDGTLAGALFGGYTPAPPDVLAVVVAGTRTGTFATVNATPTLKAVYTATQAQLVFDDGITGRTLSIGDVSITEGDSGTKTARFTVTLSQPSVLTITAQYATADDSAAAPGDYLAIALGTLTFLPNEVSKDIEVTINGDEDVEAAETFFVNLSNPTNVTIADGQGICTIQNDDAPRTLGIGDAELVEGNTGSATMRFTVTLSAASTRTITVDYATADRTAIAPGDYTALALSTLTFLPGEVSKDIEVTVSGDDLFEPDERLFVNLSNPTIAILTDAQGVGTIRNDDPRRVVPDFDLGALGGTDGFMLTGSTQAFLTSERAGWNVSDAGDVNGDGIGDVIVGGDIAAYVVFGSRDELPDDFELSTLDGTNGFVIFGAPRDTLSGLKVSAAGDMNGDGFDDVIVGSQFTDPIAEDEGLVYVIFGKATPFASEVNPNILNGTDGFLLHGGVPGNRAGLSVAAAGDVNNDGFDDVIIGGTGPTSIAFGESYVFFGRGTGFLDDYDLNLMGPNDGLQIFHALSQDDDGMAVSGAGDVNGDGFDDLIVGTFGNDTNGRDAGRSAVIFGRANFNGTINPESLDGTNGFRILGPGIGARTGYSVSGAGDLNDDGFDDLVIGARGSGPGGAVAGAAFVMFGKAGGFSAVVSLNSLNGANGFAIKGVPGQDFTGASVSGAGDVNGDGFDDLIVGAFAVDANGADSGAAYVIYGKPGGFAATFPLASLDGSNGFRLAGASAGDLTGLSVSGAGDVNGDGFADVIVGANRADPHGTDSGAAYVFFGFEAGTPQPSLSISDVSLDEGNTGTTTATFTVTLSASSNATITVQYATADGTATAGEDYVALPLATLTFLPGETTKTIEVTINGDLRVEPTEAYTLRLFNPQNALLTDGSGRGKIRNDDLLQPRPDRLIFTEPDGDTVTIRVSRTTLSPGDVTFDDDGSIATLDLTGSAGSTRQIDVTVSVVPNPTGQSDGLTRIGLLDATGVALGNVSLAANVGQFLVGAGGAGAKAANSINVQGDLGGLASTAVDSRAFGDLGKLSVTGDVLRDGIRVDGKLSKLIVGGDVRGEASARIAINAASMGKLNIAGSVRDAQLLTRDSLTSLTAGGDVSNARILAGYAIDPLGIAPVNADAQIGRVIVNGNWSASNLVAGILDGTGDGFGRNDAVISLDTTPALLSKIAEVVIRGRATGSTFAGDHFGITAQSIGRASIAGQSIILDRRAPDDLQLDTLRGDFRLVEVS